MGAILVTIFTSPVAIHGMFTGTMFCGMSKVVKMAWGTYQCYAPKISDEYGKCEKIDTSCSTFNLANGLFVASTIVLALL